MKRTDESFEDIVFENRNKDYGAYDLRKRYPKRGTIALVISLVLVFFAVGAPLIANIMNERESGDHFWEPGPVVMTPVPIDNPVPPPPPPPPGPDISGIRVKPPVIVDELTDEMKDLPPMDVLSQGVVNGFVDTSDTNEIIFVKQVVPVPEVIFETFAIQEEPIFGEGEASLIKYITENTNYPVDAIEQNIEGTVYIRFVVTKTGEVDNVRVLKGIDPLLNDEALRVVRELPKWTPGKNNGNPVNVWFIIPVKFKLQY